MLDSRRVIYPYKVSPADALGLLAAGRGKRDNIEFREFGFALYRREMSSRISEDWLNCSLEIRLNCSRDVELADLVWKISFHCQKMSLWVELENRQNCSSGFGKDNGSSQVL